MTSVQRLFKSEDEFVNHIADGHMDGFVNALGLTNPRNVRIAKKGSNVAADLMFEAQDENHSVFVSSHITSDLEKCADHITFIKDGSIQHAGTLESFMSTYRDKGATMEEIIVAVERRPWDESAVL